MLTENRNHNKQLVETIITSYPQFSGSQEMLLHSLNNACQYTEQVMCDKVDRWLRKNLPRVISNCPYGDNSSEVRLNEDIREDLMIYLNKN